MSTGVMSWRYGITRRTVLLAVAALLFAALTILVDSPELIAAAVIVWLVFYVRRVYRISILGLVFAGVCLELVTWMVSIFYHSVGSMFELIPLTILLFTSAAFLLASVVTFLIHACISRGQRRRHLLATGVACLLPVLWLLIGTRSASMMNEWELQREIARRELPAFAAEVESLAQRLGRAPEDEEELTKLLDKPMPFLSRGRIHYRSCGGTRFALEFGYDAGCYEFDSGRPERGWYHSMPGDHAPVLEKRERKPK